jgi:transposase
MELLVRLRFRRARSIGGMGITFDHKQTTVYYPLDQDLIQVDEGIAPLLLTLWDAKIRTCNSCEENEPGITWVEFYSMKEVEKLLTILIKSLGNRIQKHPEVNDWFCYRILGHEGETFSPWRFDAYPNLFPTRPNQRSIYPQKIFDSKVELSVSVRFPREDNQFVIDLISKYLRIGIDNFEELSDAQWNYVTRYIPPQPYNGTSKTEDRKILNGILYVLETGCPWTDMPRKYGSYTAVHSRLKKWSTEGVLDPILSGIERDDICKEKLSKYLTVTKDHMLSKQKRTANCTMTKREEMSPMSVSH